MVLSKNSLIKYAGEKFEKYKKNFIIIV